MTKNFLIVVALLLLAMPSILWADCANVTNLAVNATANVQIAGQTLSITEKYVTPEYAGISINGTVINLSNNTAPMQLNGYSAVLTGLSSQGASIEFCADPVLTTSGPAVLNPQQSQTSSPLILIAVLVVAVMLGAIGVLYYVKWNK